MQSFGNPRLQSRDTRLKFRDLRPLGKPIKRKYFHNNNTILLEEFILSYIKSRMVAEFSVGQRINSSLRINVKRGVIRSPASVGRVGSVFDPDLPPRRKEEKKNQG